MKPNVDDLVRIMRGYQNGHAQFEALRIRTIRESDIARDSYKFDDAFESAKFIGFKKPMTGLIHLGKLIAEMNQ